jgi:hypothetical protein
MKKKQPQSYVVLAALAGGVLCFVLDLSSAGQGVHHARTNRQTTPSAELPDPTDLTIDA